METANPNHIHLIVALCFSAIRANKTNDEAWLNEDRADRELVAFTQKNMRTKLAAARLKGRRGWWRESECSIEELKALLDQAMAKNDMASVINYAAMIQVRNIIDE